MNARTERELALDFLGRIGQGEVRAAMSLLANDVAVSLPGQQRMSRAQFQEFLDHLGEILPFESLTLRPTGVTAEGDRVAIEAEGNARLSSGVQYGNRYHFLFIVREGKIRTVNVYAEQPLADVAAWHGAK